MDIMYAATNTHNGKKTKYFKCFKNSFRKPNKNYRGKKINKIIKAREIPQNEQKREKKNGVLFTNPVWHDSI